MKTLRFSLILIGLSLGFTTIAADRKMKLTLEDVIFDPQYISQQFGPKTLVQTEDDPAEILGVLQAAKLDAKTTFIFLPDAKMGAQPKSERAPAYPASLRQGRITANASFLLMVGADGKVQSLYCYKHNNLVLALVCAKAMVKWSYTPAKLGKTPVPVLMTKTINFNYTDLSQERYRRPGDARSNSTGPLPKQSVN